MLRPRFPKIQFLIKRIVKLTKCNDMALTKKKASELGKRSSRKGVPNKTTKEIREAFNQLISSKIPQLSKWLDRVAKDDPEKALEIIIKFSDFIIPKLQRTEIKGDFTTRQIQEMTPQQRQARIDELIEKAQGIN